MKTYFDTDRKEIALTYNACGATRDGYDEELINFLREENIPATLFINEWWIFENKDVFLQLAKNPLFQILKSRIQTSSFIRCRRRSLGNSSDDFTRENLR